MFDDKTFGYGCQLKNIVFETPGEEDINFLVNHVGKSESDVVWIQIKDSVVKNLPENVFAKFINLEKVFILNCTGFANLDKPYFHTKIKLILFQNTDIEYVGDKVFANLTSVQTMSLSLNKIKSIHKDAFKDMVNVEQINMEQNVIVTLDEDTFATNLLLKNILLFDNQITKVPAKLFSRNINLETIQLQNNLINEVEENFYENLTKLTKINLGMNGCINDTIELSSYEQWNSIRSKFDVCFTNYEKKTTLYNIIAANVPEIVVAAPDDVVVVAPQNVVAAPENVVVDPENVVVAPKNLIANLTELTQQVKKLEVKAAQDLLKLEKKMLSATNLQNLTENLLKVWEAEKFELENSFKLELQNILHTVTNSLKWARITKKKEDDKASADVKGSMSMASVSNSFIYLVFGILVILSFLSMAISCCLYSKSKNISFSEKHYVATANI